MLPLSSRHPMALGRRKPREPRRAYQQRSAAVASAVHATAEVRCGADPSSATSLDGVITLPPASGFACAVDPGQAGPAAAWLDVITLPPASGLGCAEDPGQAGPAARADLMTLPPASGLAYSTEPA